MLEPVSKIWFDGQLIAWDDATVHVLAHSLHYGMATFEGIRCYRRVDGRRTIFRLDDHLQRLFDSCKILTLEPPFEQAVLRQACIEVVRANGMREAYVRPLVFLGSGGLGLGSLDNPTHVVVAAYAWGAYLGEEGLRRGIRAKISSFTRGVLNASMAKGKITGQYVNSVLAKREALKGGYAEAILLDAQGHVAEASGENVFMVKRGRLITPPLSSPILAGITRDTVLAVAGEEGISVEERTFSRDELYLADEVFLTGTAAEMTPVCEVDDRVIGAGDPGPVTRRLQQLYFEIVKGSEGGRHAPWLTDL